MSSIASGELNPSSLDAAYNNRAAVNNSDAIRAEWNHRSARLRASPDALLDLAYGPGPRQRIDFFPATRSDAPVLAFLHGGYWQANAKENFAFVAEGPMYHGFAVALIGYTLAPEATIANIVDEVRQAIAWLQQTFEGPLYVSGWSAGAHLAASIIGDGNIKGGLAISGIYDLEPLRHTYLNEKLRLTSETAASNSPIRHIPASAAPLVVAYGCDELPELRRQSRDYWSARKRADLPGNLLELDHHHHFSILDELARPDGALMHALTKLIRSANVDLTMLGKS